ncbi:divergent polysaccharide deacetylase family protein [Acanthopleuribacter pedis]|uniref:Divergent polysaccharide deacetylase family protein n=1 Tax=Acanthopleuribacter pedis TaxID=442870 RepID=A0A8J7Q427_9BACT|nr:divergent polysaccharide deacetylase family protein [Acanthopleuribacter pedis]MBO1320197.1 divergent polysaccharide deacetylase family protein [Acanthopleuribacter pedis]
MAARKTRSTGSKGRTSSARKKKKPQTSVWDWVRRLLVALFMGFVVLGAVVVWLKFEWPQGQGPVNAAMVQSVLIAAQADGDTSIQKVTKDGIERWKVAVPTRARKDAIIRALQNMMLDQGSHFDPGKERRHKGKLVQIVALEIENNKPLRLVFVVEGKASAKPKPKRNKPLPVADKPKPEPSPETDTELEIATTAVTQDIAARLAAKPATLPANPKRPMIAVIIDDVGHKGIRQIQPLLDLKLPVTFAVLPHLAHSSTNSVHLHQHHYEVILHMPMEPDNFPKTNPGEGAILSYLNETEVRTAVRKALKTVPFVVGVNNHMGSKITANRALMDAALEEVKKHDLYWIDSRTNPKTVAYALAKSKGMRTTERDVFLDAEESYAFTIKQLKETRAVADREGRAVAIGHPYPSTIRALRDVMPRLDREGYQFVFASRLLEVPGDSF